jgi:hypothetical protein
MGAFNPRRQEQWARACARSGEEGCRTSPGPAIVGAKKGNHATAYLPANASWNRSISTEIYLCHACSGRFHLGIGPC